MAWARFRGGSRSVVNNDGPLPRAAVGGGEQIIAAPTLIKHLPLPLRRMIGDMANTERILLGLDLRPA